MASSQDAVADGLVASLARPGGNVTGRSLFATELTGKRLQMLKEMMPGLSRVGALWHAVNPGGLNQFKEAASAGEVLGLAIVSLDVRFPDGIEGGMTRAVAAGVGAVIVLSDSASISHRAQITDAADRRRIPTIFANKEYIRAGGLMSYGPDLVESFRLASVHVDKILKGAKPADLPVEQPTRFELVINGRTAKARGIAIPPTLLTLADEVIE
jgi:putative tryptophan/tyrosine transport system substrate-binding protein